MVVDQIVKSEEEKAGEEKSVVDTATTKEEVSESTLLGSTKEKEQEEVSLEDIVAKEIAKPMSDIDKGKAGTPRGVQNKIDKLTRKNKDLAEKLAASELKNVSAQRPGMPDRDNFESHAEYETAFREWNDTDSQWKAAQVKISKEAEERESKIRDDVVAFQSSETSMREKFEDYDEVVHESVDFAHLDELIVGSRFGPQIAYFLGGNPKELASLLAMDMTDAFKEIGKYEGQYIAAKNKITNAPAPMTPVNGNEELAKDPYSEDSLVALSRKISGG